MPLFSIIIPTFNVKDKIALSLHSALEQQAPFADVEVLVMDGASTDGTLDIAHEWAVRDARVKVWSEPDTGIYDAMNKGVSQAKGNFLYFLGAGDLLCAGILQQVAAQPALHPQLMLYGKIWIAAREQIYGDVFELPDLARRNIPHQAIFYGREVFEEVGRYDERCRIFADHDFNWRCFTTPAIETRFVDLVVANYESGG